MTNLLSVLFFFSFIINILQVNAQIIQTVRGTIIDIESKSPIEGVTVVIADSEPQMFSMSNSKGDFRLENVPVGRITIKVLHIGYEYTELRDIELKSGKELVLTIEMIERIEQIDEVVVTANRKDKPKNDMATVSARSFTVEETERYAGTWLDPARMAANYAGVMAVGDQRNDIIIRGNSPLGLLWRLEGVNIPNPNHFGTLGTTGGPISILNNNLLDNSDFFTGAFPAEYGNALSGVFDLEMRKGNNENYEFTGQIGMNGLEFGTEGPIAENYKGSYLLNYRYSTLAVFDLLDIHFGVSGVPEFQDLSYKIYLPTKKTGTFSLFGIGGISNIDVFFDDRKDDDWSFGRGELDFHFESAMGVTGVSHFYSFDKSSYLKTVVATSGTMSSANADSAFSEPKKTFYGDNSHEIKYSVSSKYTNKFNTRNIFNAGFNIDMYNVQYQDSVLLPDETYYYLSDTNDEIMTLIGLYSQFKHRFTNDFSFTGGLYFQNFTLNQSYSLEPRLGFKWALSEQHSMSAGAGIHSQLQPRLFYFQKTEIDNVVHYTNKELDFSKSNQAVISYDYLINKHLRLKLETYYQYLNNIPVEDNPSFFSMINYGTTFFEGRTDSLVNEGTGHNYGVELTFEKFLSDNYYFLFTSSLFESKYKGSDDIERSTIYNGNYVINFLAGYSIKIGKYNTLNLDFKIVYAGGKHYIPFDLEKSEIIGDKVLDYEHAFEPQFPDYFRIDGRLGFKMNFKTFNAEFAFDVQNFTKHKNILLQSYDVDTNSVVYDYQFGLFYVFFLRFQF